ncbi:acyl-CoA thioesterase II [Pseudomaricurvus sp. HS19]|uniref:acyl-CoA thioesterase n=1 Tax=Pseudomaricurvus sp. HS19 TaxID=2692626 RepID=UPI00136C74A0|nr:acyl-CoA thioesterase domain-containing protein [Pseudomaricurvus sp. HS19]MYM62079.1 acyl-CoA thioesterase II [Pseudomaricurvus sp. HS19]
MPHLNPAQQLAAQLTPEAIGPMRFRGYTPVESQLSQVFGGQVMAQCIGAAEQTLDPGRQLHSLHGYFLRPGSKEIPLDYVVTAIRDGGSFSTRQVSAEQEGKAIFTGMLSFKLPEQGVEHQAATMPEVQSPESRPRDNETLAQFRADNPAAHVPPPVDWLNALDMRSCGEMPLLRPARRQPTHGFWFRTRDPMGEAPFHDHLKILTWVSDIRLITTAMLPHELPYDKSRIRAASLDHAVWVHHPFRVDEWIYHQMDAPVSGGGRGLNLGRFYNREGLLVASSSQEGLLRVF